MKSNIFIVAAILLISEVIFSACNKEEKIYSTKEGRIDINENEFVRMQILPDNGFINSTAKLILENRTNGILTYGRNFSLEYFDIDNWVEIQLDMNFESILLGLSAGETHEGRFNLLLFEKYNKGKKGRYRYGQNFGLFYNSLREIHSSFNLYIEFEIK